MEKKLFFRFLAISDIAILLFFSCPILKAQQDILDLNTGGTIGNCSTSPDIEINVNIIGTDPDTTIIFRNIAGYRLLAPIVTNPYDFQYKFCAANENVCTPGPANPGGFRIYFKSGGSNIGVKKISFLLFDHSGQIFPESSFIKAVTRFLLPKLVNRAVLSMFVRKILPDLTVL